VLVRNGPVHRRFTRRCCTDGMTTVPPDPADLDPEDAFGHPVLGDPARDEHWVDGDEDDVDV
jgi:hypothetical protein